MMKRPKLFIATGGSLLSAMLAFLPLACCVFPVALAGFGIGSLAFAATLMPYRPYFVVLTFIFLGVGFYFVYRPQGEECEDGSCSQQTSRKISKVMLWVVALLTLALVLFPYLVLYFPAL